MLCSHVSERKFNNRKLAHAHELTHPGGAFGKKPTYFLVDPLLLGGWPVPVGNAWDEEVSEEKRLLQFSLSCRFRNERALPAITRSSEGA